MNDNLGFKAYSGTDDFVFISYASAESHIVRDYALNLHNNGVNVWYDDGLNAGENWLNSLMQKIASPRCKGVILFLSKLSVTRPFVRAEVHKAFSLGKPIYGVYLEDNIPLDESMQTYIANIQSTFITRIGKSKALDEILSGARSILSGRGLTSTAISGSGSMKKYIGIACAVIAAVVVLSLLIPALQGGSGGGGGEGGSDDPSTTTPTTAPSSGSYYNPDNSYIVDDTFTSGSYYNPDNSYIVGDTFTFGTYEQDNDRSNGAEEIEWRVLRVDDDAILALSEKCLDRKIFNPKTSRIYWADCTLRSWLNDDFYNTAFSTGDKAVIKKHYSKNDTNPVYPHGLGTDVYDNVFCLSISEVDDLMVGSFDTLLAEATPYAVEKGARLLSNPWWLRSVGEFEILATFIHEEDRISYQGRSVYKENVAVRPAIYLEHN